MPFPPSSVHRRHEVLRERRRVEHLTAALERAQRVEQEREDYQVREMLKTVFPKIDIDIAHTLWHIVVNLTTSLVEQFEAGEEVELKAEGYYSLDLFYSRGSNRYATLPTKDRGYVDILTAMHSHYITACLGYNIGLIFTLSPSRRPVSPKTRRRYDDTVYAKVTATAPLPTEEDIWS